MADDKTAKSAKVQAGLADYVEVSERIIKFKDVFRRQLNRSS